MGDFLIAVAKGVVPALLAAWLGVRMFGVRAVAVVTAVGVFVGYGLLKRWPALPHELWSSPDATQWWLWAVVAAAVCSVLERARVLRGVLGEVVVLGLGCGMAWLMLQRLAAASPVATLAAPLAALTALVLGVRHAAPTERGWSLLVLWTACAVGAAGVLTLGGSALQGQLAGAYAAALGGSAVALVRRRPVALTAADGGAFALAHGGLLIAGAYLSELQVAPALCVGLAPLAGLGLRASGRTAVAVVWLVALAAIAAGVALAAAGRSESGY